MDKHKEICKKTCHQFQNQEERRKELLERQKKSREESRNQNRKTLTEVALISNPFSPKRAKHKDVFDAIRMVSQCAEGFPKQMVLYTLPKGQKNFGRSFKGITHAYNKNGRTMKQFKSALPGGSHQSTQDRFSYTILDCIWNEIDKIFYVLDILAWRSREFVDCETEFRFYWIKSQMFTLPEVTEVGPFNEYCFVDIQRSECDQNSLINLFASANENLDGVLFYHRNAHYQAGITPLVGWLLPWMIPEILEMEAPANSEPKPPDTDTEQFVSAWGRDKKTHIRYRKKVTKFPEMDSENLNEEANINEEEKMETQDSTTSDSSSPVSSQQDI